MIGDEAIDRIVWTADMPAAPVYVRALAVSCGGTLATVEPLSGAATDQTERLAEHLYPTQAEAHRRAVTIDRWRCATNLGARVRPNPRDSWPYEWPAHATMTREAFHALAREFEGTAVVMQKASDASGLVLVIWRGTVGHHTPEDGAPSLPTAWVPVWALVPEGEEGFHTPDPTT